ncbi:TIGR03752 family integrating conjugative element protein [Photobacterium frigidiphilum]|uniref:TIGR03752 family integrating conjugative element protein n=1 Tax=Photobacterium frigidiphilum TaxID=264736 RepID=A0A2T3JA71_9GAMM|nr:TIGR03752 family integrating conjugative element protein [Photobacterium frigidiphilum]
MTNKNKLLLILLGALFFVFAVFGLSPDDNQAPKEEAKPSTPLELSVSQAKIIQETLGITADTPADTLRTLAVTINNQKEENTQLKKAMAQQNNQYQTSVDTLQQQFTTGLAQVQTRFDDQMAQLKSRTEDIGIERPVPETSSSLSPDDNYDGLGIGHGSVSNPAKPEIDSSELIWVMPLDANTDDKTGDVITPQLIAWRNKIAQLNEEQDDFRVDDDKPTPVYTLGRGSVLSDSVAMTALIGRIPVNGQVTSPYPFSLIIGKENLMANGFMLPDVVGAIATGTVTGDWNLSCVRGVVETFDFILADGSMIAIPDGDDVTDSSFDGSDIKTNDLGFIADPNGNPCLSGTKITNATSYLTTMGLLDAATAAANAAAAAQTTASIPANGEGGSWGVSGDQGQYILANAAAGSISNANQWIKERMGSSFDVVYAQPGTPVAVHLRKTLKVDEPANARQVRYDTLSQGGNYALD